MRIANPEPAPVGFNEDHFRPPVYPPGRSKTMRKMLVIAAREYRAAIGTRTFIISLVMIPALMGASVLVQCWLPATGAQALCPG